MNAINVDTFASSVLYMAPLDEGVHNDGLHFNNQVRFFLELTVHIILLSCRHFRFTVMALHQRYSQFRLLRYSTESCPLLGESFPFI
jgi:hypothetical protein